MRKSCSLSFQSTRERCWFEISSNLEGTENVFVTQFFGYLGIYSSLLVTQQRHYAME